MVSLTGVFIIFVAFFTLSGALRGWAKEMLVAVSVVLSLFLRDIFLRFLPPVAKAFEALPLTERFLVQSALLIVCVMFGYVGPTLPGVSRGKLAREKLQDVLLGAVLGALNGYLIVGTVWYFLDQAKYPFPALVSAPTDAMSKMLVGALAPTWLTFPALYFALGMAFFIIIILWV